MRTKVIDDATQLKKDDYRMTHATRKLTHHRRGVDDNEHKDWKADKYEDVIDAEKGGF